METTMKGIEVIKELIKNDWKVVKNNEYHNFLKSEKRGKTIPIPIYKNRDLGNILISKIEHQTGIQLSKNINVKKDQISLDDILKQVKQILKDGCSEKEIKEMLSEISTPKQADKLISIAKEQLQKDIELRSSFKQEGPEM